MHRKLSKRYSVKELIDTQSKNVGRCLCDHSEAKMEMPMDGYDAEVWNRVTDHYLYPETGKC